MGGVGGKLGTKARKGIKKQKEVVMFKRIPRRIFIGICIGLLFLLGNTSYVFSKSCQSNFKDSFGYLYAIDVETGQEKWKFKTENPVASPVVFNNMLSFGTFGLDNNNSLYAVDMKTGKEIWKFKVNGRIESIPTIMDGRIYFGCSWLKGNPKGGYIYNLDVKTGKENDKKLRLNKWWAGFSFAIADGVVYSGDYWGRIYAVDIGTDKLRWKRKIGDVLSPVISNGIAYFGSRDDNTLYAVDVKTGNIKWKLQITSSAEGGFLEGLAYKDKVYFSNHDELFSADAITGQKGWNFKINGSVIPVIANDELYFIGRSAFENHVYLYVLDIKTGREKRKFKMPFEKRRLLIPKYNLIVSGDAIYFFIAPNYTDYLFALDIKTLKEKWRFKVENISAFVPLYRQFLCVDDGMIYFGTGYDGQTIME